MHPGNLDPAPGAAEVWEVRRRLAILVTSTTCLARRMRRQVKGRLSAGFDWRGQAQKRPTFRAN
jgi:hypothetical protein